MSLPRAYAVLFPLLCLAQACSTASAGRRELVVVPPTAAVDPAEPAPAPPPAMLAGIGKSYTGLKLGPFFPMGDIEDLDDGFGGELVFGNALTSFLSVEGTIGYFAADGQFGPLGVDLWALPTFGNVRGSLPMGILEPYAGVGIGGLYVEYDVGSFGASDWVPAWNGFLGMEVGLGQLALGIEGKYLQSAEVRDDFNVEGFMVYVYLSLPF